MEASSRTESRVPESERPRGEEYTKHYFERYPHAGDQPYGRNEWWFPLFDGMAEGIVRELKPASVLDAGCAFGMLVEKLRERGVEAWGIDLSDYAVSNAGEGVQPFVAQGSVVGPLPAGFPSSFDLVVSIEVLEHIAPADTHAAIEHLAGLTDAFLFSSTPDEYHDPTHINLRSPEDWSAVFAEHGLFRSPDFDARFINDWTVLYERAPNRLSDTVKRYDRVVNRMIPEIRELRDLATELQRRVSELEDDDYLRVTDRLAAAEQRIAELEQELADSRRLLGSKSGRMLRAWHAARGALNGS